MAQAVPRAVLGNAVAQRRAALHQPDVAAAALEVQLLRVGCVKGYAAGIVAGALPRDGRVARVLAVGAPRHVHFRLPVDRDGFAEDVRGHGRGAADLRRGGFGAVGRGGGGRRRRDCQGCSGSGDAEQWQQAGEKLRAEHCADFSFFPLARIDTAVTDLWLSCQKIESKG